MSANAGWLAAHPDSILTAHVNMLREHRGDDEAGVFASTNCHVTVLRVLGELGVALDALTDGAPALPLTGAAPVVLVFCDWPDEGFDQHGHVLVLHEGVAIQSFYRRFTERRTPVDAALLARAHEHDAQLALCGISARHWPRALRVSHYTTRPL